jgi:hypothetical protein
MMLNERLDVIEREPHPTAPPPNPPVNRSRKSSIT